MHTLLLFVDVNSCMPGIQDSYGIEISGVDAV